MLKKLKKSVAVVLVATFLMSMFAIAPSAAEKENKDVGVNTSDYSLSGSDSFGEMLASDISEKNEEVMQENEEFSLYDVTVNGNVAVVDYNAKEDCTILVAVYDDVTEKMLASGKSKASANKDFVEVNIETEAMPEYFMIKAFMLDDNNAPLTSSFVEERYTEGVQQVVDLEASEFDEEQVLNLDDDMSTNFAVYNENTVLVKASEQNIPSKVDEDNETYVFTMCDEKLTSLTAGDIFVYEYEDGNILIVKIKEISIDGTTVTITGDSNVELEDVFDYVKIEASQNTDNATVDMSDADAGVTYEENVPQKEDKEYASVGKKWSGEGEFGGQLFKVKFGEDDDKIKGKVEAKIAAGVEVEIYINNRFWKYKTHYIDFDFSYGAYFTGKIEVEISKEISKKLADIQVPIVTGVNFTMSPQLEAKFSGSIEFTASLEGSVGFKASLSKGVHGKKESPEFSCSLEISGDLFIGLNINPGISIIDRHVAKVELEFTAGLNLHAETKMSTAKDDDECGCKICIKGKLSPQIKFGAEAEIATKTVGSAEITFDLFSKEFYYSVDHKRFGWGECPYVNSGGSTDTTDPVPTGAEPATTPKPTTNPNPGPDPQPTTEPGPTIIGSGKCGDSATWELWSDGELNINGSGDMNDYNYTDSPCAPWSGFRDQITQVNISDGIIRIGQQAFNGCTSLKNVTIGNSVTSIGNDAFFCCSSLKNIKIPNDVISIGDGAFLSCLSLENVTIGNHVENIGNLAFSSSALTSIIIPNSVTNIGDYAFLDCKSLKSVTIPNSVTTIGKDAFFRCTNLKNVVMGNSVTYIEEYAFGGCTSLKNITIGNSVETIGKGAFNGCTSLKSITIPDRVTYIGWNAFEGCTNLEEITIPDSVTTIGKDAFFRCTNLKNVVIGNSVTYIEEYAFGGCTSLKNITIGNSVETIGKGAFNGCTSLDSITIPDSVTNIRSCAFSGCTGLKSITIPDSVTSVEGFAFSECTSLDSITIPDSVTNIGSYAFSGCTGLKSITIPDSVTNIGSHAFIGCTGLKSITIPDSVTSVEGFAFSGCTSLDSITIPDSVINIGARAFSECTSLESITISDSVTSIGIYAFGGCTSLKNVTIGNSVTSICEGIFSGCICLKNIVIGNSVRYIGEDAFYGCTSLDSITIPDSVINIGARAFSRCTSLENVVIGNSVKTIEGYTFSGCTSLTNITIPDSVKRIDINAFRNAGMKTIYGYSGSYAETFAKNQGYQFIPIEDGSVSASYASQKSGDNNSVGVSYAKATANTVSTQRLSTDTDTSKITAEYSDKVAYTDYIIAVVKDPNVEDVLSADNLLYINQYTADKDGKISASMPVADDVGDDYKVLIYGAEGGTDVPDKPKKGDVNGDDKVNIDDVTAIQKYVVDALKFDDDEILTADVNGDGKVNIDDVTMIQKYMADMITSFG